MSLFNHLHIIHKQITGNQAKLLICQQRTCNISCRWCISPVLLQRYSNTNTVSTDISIKIYEYQQPSVKKLL